MIYDRAKREAFMELSFELFETITDPRDEFKIKYKLTDILSILVCAVISGADTYQGKRMRI